VSIPAKEWYDDLDEAERDYIQAIGCITDDRQTHRTARTCLTDTPRDAEPILDFEVILQFRSRLISLFLFFNICYQQ